MLNPYTGTENPTAREIQHAILLSDTPQDFSIASPVIYTSAPDTMGIVTLTHENGTLSYQANGPYNYPQPPTQQEYPDYNSALTAEGLYWKNAYASGRYDNTPTGPWAWPIIGKIVIAAVTAGIGASADAGVVAETGADVPLASTNIGVIAAPAEQIAAPAATDLLAVEPTILTPASSAIALPTLAQAGQAVGVATGAVGLAKSTGIIKPPVLASMPVPASPSVVVLQGQQAPISQPAPNESSAIPIGVTLAFLFFGR